MMTDDTPPRRHQVTQLDIYRAIDELKKSIDGKFDRVDERLRAIESIGPSSFGPRINVIERWQDLANGPDDTPSLPTWRKDVDTRLAQIVGIGKFIRWAGVLVTLALGLIALAQWVRGPL